MNNKFSLFGRIILIIAAIMLISSINSPLFKNSTTRMKIELEVEELFQLLTEVKYDSLLFSFDDDAIGLRPGDIYIIYSGKFNSIKPCEIGQVYLDDFNVEVENLSNFLVNNRNLSIEIGIHIGAYLDDYAHDLSCINNYITNILITKGVERKSFDIKHYEGSNPILSFSSCKFAGKHMQPYLFYQLNSRIEIRIINIKK